MEDSAHNVPTNDILNDRLHLTDNYWYVQETGIIKVNKRQMCKCEDC